jgi:hypothetical protein
MKNARGDIMNMSPISWVRTKIVDATFEVSDVLEKRGQEGETTADIDNDIYRYGYHVSCRSFGPKILDKMIVSGVFDESRTYPNNIMEIADSFGIDATRAFLVVNYSKYLKINSLNIHLISDFQTSLGVPIALNHSGASRHNPATLSKVAFQDPFSALHSAAAVGITDTVEGFSDCIMTGKRVKNGTGIVRIRFLPEDLGEKYSEEEVVIEGDMKEQVYAEDDEEQRGVEADAYRDLQQRQYILPTFKIVPLLKAPEIAKKWIK